jgi:hypothetical protein
MTTPGFWIDDLKKKAKDLQEVRKEIAFRNVALANRELASRLLRLRLEDEYRRGEKGVACSSKDAAEKAAKVDPEYIAFEKETHRLIYERDVQVAVAENMVFGIRIELESLPMPAMEDV